MCDCVITREEIIGATPGNDVLTPDQLQKVCFACEGFVYQHKTEQEKAISLRKQAIDLSEREEKVATRDQPKQTSGGRLHQERPSGSSGIYYNDLNFTPSSDSSFSKDKANEVLKNRIQPKKTGHSQYGNGATTGRSGHTICL